MVGYREPERRDWLKSIVYIAAYIAAISISGFYLLLSYWYVWVALAAVGLMALVLWHAKATAYRCSVCSYEFEISVLTDLISPHGVDREGAWVRLKCPRCSNRSKSRVLAKK